MTDEKFNFTWGLPLLKDLGYVQLYRFLLTTYHRLGITRPEMLTIIHLASYHYNVEKGQSCPSLATISEEMGYSDKTNLSRLTRSLERKGMLIIKRREGKTSIYNAGPFARAALGLWFKDQAASVAEIVNGESVAENRNTTVAENRNTPLRKSAQEEEEYRSIETEEADAPAFPEALPSEPVPHPTIERLRREAGADYLDLAAHCAGVRDVAGVPQSLDQRPRGWQTESISEAEFAVCQRVADLWAGGSMAGIPRFVDPQVEAAGEVLRLLDGDVGRTLETITSYFEHYEAEWQRTGTRPFSVVGPQSLVNVLRTFEAEVGYEAEAPPRAERFLF